MARITAGFISCGLPDRYPRHPAHCFRLDKFIHTPPHPARILRGNRLCHSLHFYHRPGIIRLLGIPSGCHPRFLFLLFPQRCYGKRQLLVCTIGNLINADLCSNFILHFLLRPYPGEKGPENTLSTSECLACAPFADSGTLHPYPGRIQRIHHEFKQGVFQPGSTHESCCH